MEFLSIEKELKENSYPGRGIIIGRSEDGTKAVTAYFIMGRSENSRNPTHPNRNHRNLQRIHRHYHAQSSGRSARPRERLH